MSDQALTRHPVRRFVTGALALSLSVAAFGATTAVAQDEEITVIFPAHEADMGTAFEARINQFQDCSRLLVGMLFAVVLLPFTIAFQHLLRRGSLLQASLWSLAGRVLVLAAIVAGVQLGVIANVVMLVVPIVALLFAMFEVTAAAIYATSRNLALAALLEAGWLAWVMSVSLPVRI